MHEFTKRLALAAAVLTVATPFCRSSAASSKLAEIHGLCSPHGDALVSIEIPCTKALIRASQDPIFNARDPATEIYIIDADKLLRNLELKRISEVDAREKLLRMLLALEDRHRPDLMTIHAQQQEQIATTQRAEQEAQQAMQRNQEAAQRDRKAAENRRANAEMIEAAQNRAFQKQHDDLVAFCVATANQRIRANPIWYNDNFFVGIHPDKSCEGDPYWYKTIPTLQSQVAGRVYQ
jgi:hypothetical protein